MQLIAGRVYGQYNTPTINGSIGSGEYGSHADGENMLTTGGAKWYMTWNADSLYIGIENIQIDNDHASVVYIDFNNIDSLPDGGTNADGTVIGHNNYDNVVYAPTFRADFVLYFKDNYYEFRHADGTNAWSGNLTTGLNYQKSGTGSNQTEEIAIPWDSITKNIGIPSKFLWLGYRQRNSGTSLATFQDVPFENQDISAGNGSAFYEYASRHFSIGNTSSGTSTKPFSRNCYIHPTDAGSSENFNDLTVYNFTMNQASKTIVKNATNRFKINGLLQIQQGILDLGTSSNTYNDTIVGHLKIGVNGQLKLSTGTANIYVKSNFYNYGGFSPNGSIVGFNGTSAAQTLVGYLDRDNAFARLQINNPNGIVVMPVDSLSIIDDLILDSGKIVMSSNYLKLRNTATCTPEAGRANSYVDGVVFWESFGTTPRKFPIGKGSAWGQAYITPEQNDSRGTALRQYKMQYFNTGHGTYSLKSQSPQLDHVSYVEYWTLDETSGADSINKSCKIKLFWKTSSDVGTSTHKDSLLVCHFNSTDWEWIQSSNTVDWFSTDSGSVEAGFTSLFSPITIGSLTASNPLPITLLSFKAKRTNPSTAYITWQTATETNNAAFELWRSIDAINFEKIKTISADAPNSNQIKNYFYIDNEAPSIVTYYKLIQRDLDGKSSPFGPVDIGAFSVPKFVIYPNPTSAVLQFESDLNLNQIKAIEIYNGLGQLIQQLPIANKQILDLPTGVYSLQITTTQGLPIIRKFTIVK